VHGVVIETSGAEDGHPALLVHGVGPAKFIGRRKQAHDDALLPAKPFDLKLDVEELALRANVDVGLLHAASEQAVAEVIRPAAAELLAA
jgi:hypothetical protein